MRVMLKKQIWKKGYSMVSDYRFDVEHVIMSTITTRE